MMGVESWSHSSCGVRTTGTFMMPVWGKTARRSVPVVASMLRNGICLYWR